MYKIKRSFRFDGRRYYVYGNSEFEVAEKILKKKKELEEALNYSGGNMTVRSWSKECIEVYKPNLDGAAYKNFKIQLESCVLKYIGSVQLKKVTPIMCQKVLNEKAGYSQYYINRTLQFMKWLFQKAVDNGFIHRSPVVNLVKPKGTYSPRRSLTISEQEVFLEAVKRHDKSIYFLLMFYCGCRPSEAAEARESDLVDKSGGLFLHIRGTKSKNADRYVPVVNELSNVLPTSRTDNYLCPTKTGRKMDRNAKRNAWSSLTREMNIIMGCKVYRNRLIPPLPLADDLTTYCLRHTFCTNLAKAGIDVRTAQSLMGHSSIELTANIYTHVDDDLLKDAAKLMNNKKYPQKYPQA